MANKYMTRLAEFTRLHHYPKEQPFKEQPFFLDKYASKGAVIGARDGYLVAAGFVPDFGYVRGADGFGILVRFKELDQPEMLQAKLEGLSLQMGWKMQTNVNPAPFHSALWIWRCLIKPKPEKVAERVEAMLAAVKQVAPALNGRCEICDTAPTPEITVYPGWLRYECQTCKERIRLESEASEQEYEARPANSARGLTLGLAAALVGGFVWASICSVSMNSVTVCASRTHWGGRGVRYGLWGWKNQQFRAGTCLDPYCRRGRCRQRVFVPVLAR